jgi:hypothetical protein
MSDNEELDIAIWRELPFDMYEYIVRMLNIDTRLVLKIQPGKLIIPKNIPVFQATNKMFRYLVNRKALIEINIYGYHDIEMQFFTHVDYDKEADAWKLNDYLSTCNYTKKYPDGCLMQTFTGRGTQWSDLQLKDYPEFIYDD